MKILRSAIVAAAALVLAGCTPPLAEPPEPTVVAAPVPSATPTATPTPTMTPEPEPAVQAGVQEIIVSTEAVTVLAGDGSVIATHDYFEPTENLVATFTEVFGFAPTREHIQPYEGWSGVKFEWEGFSVFDRDSDPRPPIYVAHSLHVEVQDVRGVEIATVAGVRVGDSVADLERRFPDSVRRSKEWFTVDTDIVDLPAVGENESGYFQHSTLAYGPDATKAVQWINVPSENWGI